MNGNTPDFVIKKKRKRAHAVDPCLGFYSFPPSIEPQIFIEQDRRDHDVPPIVTLDPVPSLHAILDSMDPSVEPGNGRNDDIAVLTVEDFLQRSAKKPPTKSYGRRKRKIAELLSDSAEMSTSPTSPSSSSPKMNSVKKKNPAPRKKAKLAERLIRAAVLAHANPTKRLRRRCDSIIVGSSRQALHFVNQVHSPVKMRTESRTTTLVDPRKIAPLHEPAFARHSSLVVDSHKHKPVTQWKSACHGLSYDNSPRSTKMRPSIVRDKYSTRIPLSFIPLQDAETAYVSKFISTKRDHPSKLHLTPVKSSPKPRRAPPLVPAQLKTPMNVVLQEDQMQDRPSKRVKFSSPVSSPIKQLSSNEKLRVPATPVTPSLSTCNSQSQQDGHSSSSPPYRNSSASRHGSPDLSTTLHAPNSELSNDLKRYPATKKPLKALASFLGSFLETARNATQMQASKSSRSSVKYKRTKGTRSTGLDAVSTTLNSTQIARKSAEGGRTSSTPHLQPLGSMRSFMQTPIRNHSSSVAKLVRQRPSPVGPSLLRTLTARYHLPLESVKSQTSISPFVAKQTRRDVVPSGSRSEPASTPLDVTSTSSGRFVLPPLYSGSRALPSTTPPSPQEILAALQPPKAQIVLSSSLLSEDFSHTVHECSWTNVLDSPE